MNIREAASYLDSLVCRLSNERSELYSSSIDKEMKTADRWGISTERRVRTRKKRNGEQAEDAGLSLTLASEIDRVMKCAIDTL